MSYDLIDRFLRNNLDDDDYKEYSVALDELCTPKRPWVGLMGNEINALSPFYVEPSTHDMIRAAEAILKGKNDG